MNGKNKKKENEQVSKQTSNKKKKERMNKGTNQRMVQIKRN